MDSQSDRFTGEELPLSFAGNVLVENHLLFAC